MPRRGWTSRRPGRAADPAITQSLLILRMKTFKNFIAGEWVAPSTDEYFDNINPADTTDIVGRFPLSGREDVERAITSAKRGFERWKRTPAPARGDVLRRVGDIMTARKDEPADPK